MTGRRTDNAAARIGRRGERRACRWLTRRGWRMLARNHRLGRDEIDLLMESPDRRVIACVEVKASSLLDADVLGRLRLDAAKRRCLRRSARVVARRFPDHAIRIDLITVAVRSMGRSRVQHFPSILEQRAYDRGHARPPAMVVMRGRR